MSVYSEISKKIGWQNAKRVNIPSLEEAKKLQNEVMLNHCANAFEKVFEITRFAPNPDGGEDSIAMKLIWDTFLEGAKYFK